MVVTKSGTGTWGMGHGEWDMGNGTWGMGHEDWDMGLGDMGLGDEGLRNMGLGDRIVSMQGVLKLLKTSWAAMEDFPGK